MGRNVAVIGRREVEAHRQFVTGITACDPVWKEVDAAGNKGWVVDVFLDSGYEDLDGTITGKLFDVSMSSQARQKVSEEGQPVVLERSKQMGWTVIGRADVVPAGFAIGTIYEENYHRFQYNFRSLKLSHVPDLDWELETLGDAVSRWNGGDESAFQLVRAWDAFGHQVLGPEVINPPQEVQDRLSAQPKTKLTKRHLVIRPETLGEAVLRWNSGDTSAMQKTLGTLVISTT